MRFRRVSITTVAVVPLLLTLASAESEAQTRRLGMLRPAPRPNVGVGAPRPRWASISPHFFTSCFVVPSFPLFPWFGGGIPFINVQIFTGNQPAPDPTSHAVPDPSTQPVPLPGSHPVPATHPVPGGHPIPGLQPAPGAVTTHPHGMPVFASPVYSAPIYRAPVYGPAAPVAPPHVRDGMVVGDVIDDPTFWLWGGSFFFGGGGIACLPTRYLGGTIFVR